MKRATSSEDRLLSLSKTVRLTTFLRFGFKTVFRDLPVSARSVVLKNAAETVATRECPERASFPSSAKAFSLISTAVMLR